MIYAMNDENYVFRSKQLTLHVSKKVINVWENCRQTRKNNTEKFGVMIGYQTDGDDEYWIELVTTPFSNDRSTRLSFLLQDKNHQNIVNTEFMESGGTSIYLGTWHTHPENIPSPSVVDRKDWISCIKRNPDRQLFFVIVGIKELRVYVRNSFGFRKLY